MATNLEVGKYKNIGERTCIAPSLNFMFVPSSRNKHAAVKCCTQLGQVGKWSEVGVGGGGMGPAENASSSFAAFCDSRKTIKKMTQPSPPCLKPSLHNRHYFFFFLSFSSSFLACLALARATKRPSDHSVSWLAGVFVINVYLQVVSLAVIFVSWMKVGAVPSSAKLNILFY